MNRRSLAALCLILLGVRCGHAQNDVERSPEVLRSSSSLVVVYVAALDKQNSPASLEADQLTLTDNGTPQTIAKMRKVESQEIPEWMRPHITPASACSPGADSTYYYEIDYYPDATTRGGGLHKIELRDKQGKLRLYHRAGYYRDGDKPEDGNDPALTAAACNLSKLSGGLRMRADVSGADEQARAQTILDGATLRLAAQTDGSSLLRLRVASCVVDNQGSPLAYFERVIEQTMSAVETQKLGAGAGLRYTLNTPLPEGSAEVRVAMHNLVDDTTASARIAYTRVRQQPMSEWGAWDYFGRVENNWQTAHPGFSAARSAKSTCPPPLNTKSSTPSARWSPSSPANPLTQP